MTIFYSSKLFVNVNIGYQLIRAFNLFNTSVKCTGGSQVVQEKAIWWFSVHQYREK